MTSLGTIKVEALLLKAAISSEIDQELQKVKEEYADDIDADKLAVQLALLKQQVASKGLANTHLPGCITKTLNYLVYFRGGKTGRANPCFCCHEYNL